LTISNSHARLKIQPGRGKKDHSRTASCLGGSFISVEHVGVRPRRTPEFGMPLRILRLSLTLLAALQCVIPPLSVAQWIRTSGPEGGTVNAFAVSGAIRRLNCPPQTDPIRILEFGSCNRSHLAFSREGLGGLGRLICFHGRLFWVDCFDGHEYLARGTTHRDFNSNWVWCTINEFF
jgi:hypothetical protein